MPFAGYLSGPLSVVARMAERQVKHFPGIAKPEASWDDAVQAHVDHGDRYWWGTVCVTAEFMRDADVSLDDLGGLILDGVKRAEDG